MCPKFGHFKDKLYVDKLLTYHLIGFLEIRIIHDFRSGFKVFHLGRFLLCTSMTLVTRLAARSFPSSLTVIGDLLMIRGQGGWLRGILVITSDLGDQLSILFPLILQFGFECIFFLTKSSVDRMLLVTLSGFSLMAFDCLRKLSHKFFDNLLMLFFLILADFLYPFPDFFKCMLKLTDTGILLLDDPLIVSLGFTMTVFEHLVSFSRLVTINLMLCCFQLHLQRSDQIPLFHELSVPYPKTVRKLQVPAFVFL